MEGIKCKRCSTAFDETVRPRCLPCGHSFCSNCLDDLITSEDLTCPKCEKHHPASNGSNFPINYDLEENSQRHQTSVLTESSSQVHNAKSSIMKKLIHEQKREAEQLLLSSEDFQHQATFYEEYLLSKRSEHEKASQRLSHVLEQNLRIIKEIDAERERMKEALKDVTACRGSLKQKLSQMYDTQDTGEAIASIVSLDSSYVNLEKWKEHVYCTFPKVELIDSLTQILLENGFITLLPGLCKVDRPIPDLSNELSDLNQRINSITGEGTLKVDTLLNSTDSLRRYLESGLISAIQYENGVQRHAKLTVRDDRVYLHHLQEGQPNPHVYTIKHKCLMDSVGHISKTAFLDIAWDGKVRGRVHIELYLDMALALQFKFLCTGILGKTYAGSKFHSRKIWNLFHSYEGIQGGDYENKFVMGGASIIQGLSSGVQPDNVQFTEGSVYATFGRSEGPKHSQFTIVTGKGRPNMIFGGFSFNEKKSDQKRFSTETQTISKKDIKDVVTSQSQGESNAAKESVVSPSSNLLLPSQIDPLTKPVSLTNKANTVPTGGFMFGQNISEKVSPSTLDQTVSNKDNSNSVTSSSKVDSQATKEAVVPSSFTFNFGLPPTIFPTSKPGPLATKTNTVPTGGFSLEEKRLETVSSKNTSAVVTTSSQVTSLSTQTSVSSPVFTFTTPFSRSKGSASSTALASGIQTPKMTPTPNAPYDGFPDSDKKLLVFGKVLDGMDILKCALSNHINSTEIIDCGIILPLRNEEHWFPSVEVKIRPSGTVTKARRYPRRIL